MDETPVSDSPMSVRLNTAPTSPSWVDYSGGSSRGSLGINTSVFNAKPTYREKEIFIRKVKNGYIIDDDGQKHVASSKESLFEIITNLLEIRP